MEISIVIPSYNNAEFLDKCLDSAINQTFDKPYEIIFVNDSSDDNTLEIVNKKKDIFPNIIIKNANYRSAILSRVEGIKASSGRYIMFLDSDDYYRKDALEVMYNKIESSEADLVNCSHYYVRKHGIRKNILARNKTLDKYGALKDLLFDASFHGFLHTKIYKASILKSLKLEFPKENFLHEDTLLNVLYILRSKKIVTISTPLVYYNKANEHSLTSSSTTRIRDEVNVYALIRVIIERENDARLLRIFKHGFLRTYLTLITDFVYTKYSFRIKQKIKRKARKELRYVFKAKNFNRKDKSFESFLAYFD